MKLISLFTLVLGSFIFVSCAPSTPATRIDKNFGLFTKLSEKDRGRVMKGELRKGMTPQAVFLAWGEPASKTLGEESGKRFEKWTYTRLQARHVNTFSLGFHSGYGRYGYGRRRCGYGHGGFGYAPQVIYQSLPTASVDFTNGKVTGWKRVEHVR